jgi:glutathione S-transferase
LEETRPEKPLLPKDSFKRAQVRNVCGIIGSDIQPVQNLGVLQMVFTMSTIHSVLLIMVYLFIIGH